MPNQLEIPWKLTSPIPIAKAVSEYIRTQHTYTNAAAFHYDIARWETLRTAGVGGVLHSESIAPIVSYHTQLAFILTKLPVNINLPIPYRLAFDTNAPPLVSSNLNYERACVLFNLAALFSQLAAAEERSNGEGIKRASGYFQSAAGILSFLSTTVLPPLLHTRGEDNLPTDLDQSFIRSLELLMLAQAQECFWQKAVLDGLKNGTIAKLAAQVSSFYSMSLATIQAASIQNSFPRHWVPHLVTKQHHFEAAAYFRKSMDDSEANRHGYELARLAMAQAAAKKGVESSQRGVAQAVVEDIKALNNILYKDIARAQQDNDLIYHDDVPPITSLPPIEGAIMVKAAPMAAIEKPQATLGGEEQLLFTNLVGWGVRVAADIYADRRKTWLDSEIYQRTTELDAEIAQSLRSLNLPASLEALERPIGLPPSLLRKADEVRSEEGPERIKALLDDVRKLAQQDGQLLSEAFDILDAEAEEDESYRNAFAQDKWTRPASHEVNSELTEKATRYRGVLDKASESDGVVRDKWEDWEEKIVILAWEEPDLEATIPSTTFFSKSRSTTNPAAIQTQNHARALRALLEQVDDLQRSRKQIVQRAERLSEVDDIKPRILDQAAKMGHWVEVRPEMFEDTIEEELGKYEKFRNDLDEGVTRQDELFAVIRERNDSFLQSRREDPAVKDRERALQSLDLAYHKYRELVSNLTEGLKFYNDFAAILTQFREACKQWVYQRRDSISWLTQTMNNVSLTPPSTMPTQSPPQVTSSPPWQPPPMQAPAANQPVSPSPPTSSPPHSPPQQGPVVVMTHRSQQPAFSYDLPHPDSTAWEAVPLGEAEMPRQLKPKHKTSSPPATTTLPAPPTSVQKPRTRGVPTEKRRNLT